MFFWDVKQPTSKQTPQRQNNKLDSKVFRFVQSSSLVVAQFPHIRSSLKWSEISESTRSENWAKRLARLFLTVRHPAPKLEGKFESLSGLFFFLPRYIGFSGARHRQDFFFKYSGHPSPTSALPPSPLPPPPPPPHNLLHSSNALLLCERGFNFVTCALG